MKSKPYVQFSKRIVVLVTICVTLISLVGMVLSYAGNGLEEMEHAVEAYIRYATIVFVAYSGNSAMEKWLIKTAGSRRNDTNDNENEVNG